MKKYLLVIASILSMIAVLSAQAAAYDFNKHRILDFSVVNQSTGSIKIVEEFPSDDATTSSLNAEKVLAAGEEARWHIEMPGFSKPGYYNFNIIDTQTNSIMFFYTNKNVPGSDGQDPWSHAPSSSGISSHDAQNGHKVDTLIHCFGMPCPLLIDVIN